MFKLTYESEANVFAFAKKVKEFWSEKSESALMPACVVLRHHCAVVSVLICKREEILLDVVKACRIGAGIDGVSICIDRNIESKGLSLLVSSISQTGIAARKIRYSIDDRREIHWGEDLDSSPEVWRPFEAAMSRELSFDEIRRIGAGLGFSLDRQFFHCMRQVFSYLSHNEDIYVIDLVSPRHPEWVDAESKLSKLCESLFSRGIITMSCRDELISAGEYLGKMAFLDEVEQIVCRNIGALDAFVMSNPKDFAERLHQKIFDFRFDLHNSEMIHW